MAAEAPGPEVLADEEADERICRYCFEGTDEGELVSPCRCSGGQKWVHLTCLRRWQRGVLSALPSYPGLVAENRQRVCNICSSAFTIPPPTHMELLMMYTGSKVAELIAEGSFIGSHRGFSNLLQRQLAALPATLRDGVGHRHWIRGLFLVVRVITSTVRTMRLQIDDDEDLQTFARKLEDGWAFEMHGRQFIVSREGPLAGTDLPDDADASRIRHAVLALRAPVALTLRSSSRPDEGEDGVIAVNLTRRITLQRHADSYKRATFAAAARTLLEREAGEVLLPIVSHFIGGPCDEDEAACCIVIGGSKEPYTLHHCLLSGLCEAQAQAKGMQAAEALSTAPPLPDVPDEWPAPAPRSLPPAVKRRRAASTGNGPGQGPAESTSSDRNAEEEARDNPDLDAQETQHGTSGPSRSSPRLSAEASRASSGGGAAPAPPESDERVPGQGDATARFADDGGLEAEGETKGPTKGPVRLLVFWGSAGWSRRQLLGETARGSWGLCPGEPDTIVEGAPDHVWEAVYPRLAFAPHSEISEEYVRQDDSAGEAGDAGEVEEAGEAGEAAEDEDGDPDHPQWADLRRFLALHRSSAQAEESQSNEMDTSSEEDPGFTDVH